MPAQYAIMSSQLAIELGRLLRNRREKAGWTQHRLAREAGTSQQHLSRVERGDQAAGLGTVDRLFTVLGWRVHVDLAVLDDELDDRIDRIGEIDDAAKVSAMWVFQWYLDKAAGLPYVIEGELGALLHGVPLRTGTLSISVAEQDLDVLAQCTRIRGGPARCAGS